MTTTPAGQIFHFYTNPDTGQGIPCTVLNSDDGRYEIELTDGQIGVVTAGDLYRQDESGRYLGAPL